LTASGADDKRQQQTTISHNQGRTGANVQSNEVDDSGGWIWRSAAWPSWLLGKDQTDANRNDANGNNVDPDDGYGRPQRLALCASFDRIREFVLSHTLLFCNDGGEVDGSGVTQNAGLSHIAHATKAESHGCIQNKEEGAKGGRAVAAPTATAIGCRSSL
jgi:hypothetical protein